MIKLKSPAEIALMIESGKIASTALQKALEATKAGATLLDLDTIVNKYIREKGASPSFRTIEDYGFATCISVNEGIVHGIPTHYALKASDVVSIDLGVYLNGFHSDLSYSFEIETNTHKDFLDAGKRALEYAIARCCVGNRLGDVSSAIQHEIESHGWSVSRDLVGHGIGKDLHEDPYVPCYGAPGSGLKLKEGMVLAVEVIYQKGRPELNLKADGWTLETADKSLSALFEKTVAVTKNGPVLITTF